MDTLNKAVRSGLRCIRVLPDTQKKDLSLV